ncbi:hypothetical protein [Photorhabdus stackebrandtii]|uniref:GAPS4 PD-(D/E)XK nuclease domain-containing protein n=1 Tax=Photorhabdus stackebrandtii TaxID=1123042 RepID=A0A7X5QMP9_9GAMM|nr:hypothetical protein [Photorhabdus stackebrandtii]NHB97211.1 hypothetical protein [Photorhabdus stackebrandtii]
MAGGETAAIQRVANLITQKVFTVFKWKRALREDMNWPCETEAHGKDTHPSDVVFYYTNPYEEEVVYLNTDLKSYGRNSIKKGTVESALCSLSLAVECANSNEEWRKKYLEDDSLGFDVRGLLFIYNHDQLYDANFYDVIMKQVDMSKLTLPSGQKIYLLDPFKIYDIINIAFDIKYLIGEGNLPHPDKYCFYYPDMSLTRLKHPLTKSTPATIEALTSPYLIIKHEGFNYDNEHRDEGYVIYYNQVGSSVDEFVYFFDMLSNFQILTENKNIKIRLIHAHPHCESPQNFINAKKKYSSFWLLGEQKSFFDKITMEISEKTIVNFNLEEIGMGIR